MSELWVEAPVADDLLGFIDQSPTPWHAAAAAVARLEAAGFEALDEADPWDLAPGRGYYVVRDGSSVIAFRVGDGSPARAGYRIIGAHTDSPGLRLKPQPVAEKAGWSLLTAEVYGGPILATFADRDLTVAGRLVLRGAHRPREQLFHHAAPLLRIPNLAIHMNRAVNEDGLKLDVANELNALFQPADAGARAAGFERWLCDAAGVESGDLLGFELALCDTQPGCRYGPQGQYIASGRLDNLTSTHAAVAALTGLKGPGPATSIIALFDHEEIGSESFKGAGGTFLADALARIGGGLGLSAEDQRRALANSWLLSADTAHAHHPNFPGFYDEQNTVQTNGGPALKINAKQRYATDALGEAFFRQLCERAEIPVQRYVHRANLPCGSTIGPISAARLGVRTIDIGSPIWSMHSARESGGALDQDYLLRAMAAVLQSTPSA